MTEIALPLVLVVLLIAANAVFVGAEFSFVTVNRDQIQRAADRGDRQATRIAAAARELSFHLSSAQLGITISSLIVGYLAESAIAQLLEPLVEPLPGVGGGSSAGVALVLALVLASGAQMVFGELAPKNIAIARPERTARLVAPPQLAFSLAFGPLIRVLNGAANAVVRALGVKPAQELDTVATADELGIFAGMSARAGLLHAGLAGMLRRSVTFGERRAHEVMTPRRDVASVAARASVDDLLDLARRTGRRRFPVVERDIDDVRGIVDAVRALTVPVGERRRTPVSTIMDRPLLVPAALPLDDLLRRVSRERSQMAVIVDEYGGTAGVATEEDLLEEVVGELAAEYEREQAHAEPPSEVAAPRGGREVGALLRRHEITERTGFRMPDGPFDTVAGLVLARLGHLPEPGESVEVDGWRITVVETSPRRIERVRLDPPERDRE